ncbi:sensor histidine kinase [Cohnella thailandensis]|uniref:histidine kinase n=1 Tax=Cohnella thailandensis TaxID=557557 RepID=A0A841STW9_9BACL|nr:sensor histidine kinase [Cohnella thailandensis]MBB6633465.1 sensor histidine kinase [Cohnella thailandensis]MBP1974480.1 two-component system sensor histidine kinase YesM [Cohnella thailandensis]
MSRLHPVHWYSGLGLKHKFLAILIGILLAGLVLCSSAIQLALHLYDRQIYEESSYSLNLYASGIENELKRVEDLSLNLMADEQVQRYLANVQEKDEVSYDTFAAGSRIVQNQMLDYMNNEPYIESVRIIDAQGTKLFAGIQSGILDEGKLSELYGDAKEAEGGIRWVAFRERNGFFYAVRLIRERADLSMRTLGALVFEIDMDKLIRYRVNEEAVVDKQVVIFAEPQVLYSNSDLSQALISRLPSYSGSGYKVEKIDGERLFVSRYTSKRLGWSYVQVIPHDTLFQNIVYMRSGLLLAFAGIFIVVLLIGHYFSRTLTRPIETLSRMMSKVQRGQFDIEEKDYAEIRGRKDEIVQLFRHFRSMVDNLNELIQENYRKQLMLKDTEFKALQAQINPHFLYNTLESINWQAKISKHHTISQMVEALGKLMRQTVDNKSQTRTLAEELEMVHHYITIQKIRFGKRLAYESAPIAEQRQILVPKLMLQPLVENSISYGMERAGTILTIVIAVECIDDMMYIRVSDNGPGMEPELLERIMTGDYESKGTGIGLKNIRDRMRILYGNFSSFALRSTPGEGTEVILGIPLAFGEEGYLAQSDLGG